MATKKITDLQLRDNVTDDLNFPSDDGIQSYRVTGAQVQEYVLANEVITKAMLSTAVQALLSPAGMLAPFAGSTAPTGWLLCYGQAVSRTTYADLFTAISTTYGTGDGSTTFNLPDLRGRTAVGKDNMGGSAASRMTSGGSGIDGSTLGASGGTQTHIMTESEMPSHTHIQNQHRHGIVTADNASNASTAGDILANNLDGGTFNTNYATATNQNTGGGAAHLNTQPSMILNYIIKH